MRRLFIIRKDLHMSPGKVAAQVGHCAEIYWLHMIRNCLKKAEDHYIAPLSLDKEVTEGYILENIVKTVCQARNLNHLLKAKEMAKSMGLVEGVDYGLVRDTCRTELQPENEDGTTTTAIWFKPLPDDVAHLISRKYHLYMDSDSSTSPAASSGN